MRRKNKKDGPAFVVRDGKAAAVILDIDEYRALLERLEDAEDLAELEALKRRALKYKTLDEVLEELDGGV
jgi:PHD/YefM family antitoxin component YafN of YafNO toxin-antitoxin module